VAFKAVRVRFPLGAREPGQSAGLSRAPASLRSAFYSLRGVPLELPRSLRSDTGQSAGLSRAPEKK